MRTHILDKILRFSAAGKKLSAAAAIVGLGIVGAQAQQTAGSLDPAFNGSGKVISNLGNPDNAAGAVAVQADGKIVVAGLTGAVDTMSKTPGSSDFVVVRYNANGTFDNSFDGDGKAVTSFGDGEDGAGAVLIQPDGKILAAGAINTKTPAGQIALARYNPNGSLDASFDGDGKVTTDVAELQNVEERVDAMVLQPDGKILVLVSSVRDDILDDDVFVVRYNADGSRDFSFAGDGITSLPWVIAHGVAQGLTGSDLALQPDGRIVVAGTVTTAEGSDFFVWRINPDGTDDQTFNGRAAVVSLNEQDRAVAVFVQPDNKIFVAGETFNAAFRNDFAFARFSANGTLDNSFDGDGRKTTVYDAAAFHIALDFEKQANGKFVAAGVFAAPSTPADSSFAVTRFTPDGNLDPSFDGDGKTTTDFGGGGNAAFALTIQSDGKIIAAGSSENGAATDDFNVALARYIGDAVTAPRDAEFDFDGDGKADISVFRPAGQAEWFYLRSGSNDAFAAAQWGLPNDFIAPADYDGDGRTDIAVWRDEKDPNRANFYILNSGSNTVRAEQFGRTGDAPWSGDWDGDGRADLAVFRTGAAPNEQSRFFYRPSSAPGTDFIAIDWGVTGDQPMRGDFDGDGRLDAAVFRPSTNVWYIRQSSNGEIRFENWGLASDQFVPADYDGDGRTDLAVWRGGTWMIKPSTNAQPQFIEWGAGADRPVPADYTGDGKADPAVYRSGAWYILTGAGGAMKATAFGTAGDRPVPTAYLR